MTKRAVFITSRLLWPVDNGRKTSLNYYCKGLHEQFGYDIYLYCFAEEGLQPPVGLPSYIKEVRLAAPIGFGTKVKSVLSKSFGSESWPIQCALYTTEDNKKAIREYCDEVKPDVILTEMIRTSMYLYDLQDTGAKLISNLDDLLSKRYRRQRQSAGRNSSVAGGYAGSLPGWLEKFVSSGWIKGNVLEAEAKRCEAWEKRIYDLCDFVMFTSPVETDEANRMMGGQKALTLSVGVDYTQFSRELPGLEKEKGAISFVGNFEYAPNRESLVAMKNEILPYVNSDYTLYVVGKCPDEFRRGFADNERIVFLGRVDDLTEFVRKTEVFLSPITFGTGIKTKIIEAMAMGMPIITNSIGAEGIPVESGTHMMVCDDPRQTAELLDELLSNQELRENMGQAAQQMSYELFRWDVVYQTFEEAGL